LEPFDLHRRQATSLSSKKKAVGITSSLEVLDYFKGLAQQGIHHDLLERFEEGDEVAFVLREVQGAPRVLEIHGV